MGWKTVEYFCRTAVKKGGIGGEISISDSVLKPIHSTKIPPTTACMVFKRTFKDIWEQVKEGFPDKVTSLPLQTKFIDCVFQLTTTLPNCSNHCTPSMISKLPYSRAKKSSSITIPCNLNSDPLQIPSPNTLTPVPKVTPKEVQAEIDKPNN